MKSSHPAALLALLAVAAGSTVLAKTINVPADCVTIQAAIGTAADGDVVIVAPGTYKECIDFKGKAITVRSTDPTDKALLAATIIDGDKKGSVVSFKSGETAASAISGFTITNGNGTRMVSGTGEEWRCGGGVICIGSSPTISRNVIGGNRTGEEWPTGKGGGVYCQASSAVLSDNSISGNEVVRKTYWDQEGHEGGGVWCSGSSVTLTGNEISRNVAGSGAGIFLTGSSAVLTGNDISGNTAGLAGGGVKCERNSKVSLSDNTISDNRAGSDGHPGSGGGVCCWGSTIALDHNEIALNAASSFGGGVYCDACPPGVVENNTISRNRAESGGGVACSGNSSPALIGNTIAGNAATDGGGGVYCLDSSPSVTGNEIRENTAGRDGGGVDLTSSSPALTDNTIFGNSAQRFGGGIACSFSSSVISNCTISSNSAGAGGGLSCWGTSTPTVTNTIVSFHSNGGGLYCWDTSSRPVVTYCCIYMNGIDVNLPRGMIGGKTNVHKDPLFADAANGDFHLRSKGGRWDPTTKAWIVDTVHSPCIDAGDPKSPSDKEPTPNRGRVNMGAYGNTAEASKSGP